MLILTPVVESFFGPSPYEWLPDARSEEFVGLSGETPDADCADVLAMLSTYNDVASSGSVDQVARAILRAEHLILPGGLMAERDGATLVPGCCCGLEDWRDWFAIFPNSAGPFLGHDPSPRAECGQDGVILWIDENMGKASARIEASYPEVDAALAGAQRHLAQFKRRFADWLAGHTPVAEDLAEHFATLFHVSERP